MITAFLHRVLLVLNGDRNGNSYLRAYQVMTLSGTGEAETPAGGSVCIRYSILSDQHI